MEGLDAAKTDESQQHDEAQPFDISKICRACLTEKDEMCSVFTGGEDTFGQGLRLAEIVMGFTTVQIESGDGLPTLLCLQCAHLATQCFAFKHLCEQSDTNLRQYLGKPALKQKSDVLSIFSNKALLKDLALDNSSSDSDEDDEDDFRMSAPLTSPEDIKLAAQKQLLKITSKLQKAKSTKKKSPENKLKQAKTTPNKCNVCRKQFNNVKAFLKHLRTHIEDRPFACKLCPRSFTEENYLNNHMKSHLPDSDKPHECEYCKARFIHVTLLKKHLMKHSGEKPYVCKICNKGCYAENSLVKHMKIHERKQGDPALLKHMCDYCKTEFPNALLLADHIKQHTGDRPFLCTICGKCFPQRFNLDLHLRTHTGERPFECEICKNGYVSKASLKIHMRTHTNERPFVCDFCGRAFRQSGDLTSHKRLHGTDKPIECSVCQKRFTTVMKLKYHMRNHTGERPYVCNVCGRGFTVNTILNRHMRVHSGERPYVCVTCGKAFSQSSTLNTHMKIHAAPSPKYAAPPLIIVPSVQPAPPVPALEQSAAQRQADQSERLPKFHEANALNNEQPAHNSVEVEAAAQVQVQVQQVAQVSQMQIQHPRTMCDETDDESAMLQTSSHAHMLDEFKMPHDEEEDKYIDTKSFIADDARLLVNVAEPRLLVGDDRLMVEEGMIGDVAETKYLNNYDPYQRDLQHHPFAEPQVAHDV